jgi:MFS family permease
VPLLTSLVGVLPIGMFGLGILLLVREATGSFADAGRVVAAFGLANALGAVAQGRLMDRLGQTRVLRVAAVVHAAGLAALLLAAAEDAPGFVLTLSALVAGASLPQLPAAMRSLWGTLVPDDERRRTAYALVSIMFEVSVISAPVLVAAVASLASPSAAVLVAVAFSVGGALAFSLTHASRRWRGVPHAVGWLGPLEARGMRVTLAVLTLFGIAIGIIQVAAPAFMAERGSAAAGGLLLAALSGGSLVGGIAYGARTWPGAPRRQLVALMAGLGGAYCLLAFAGVPIVLAALLAVCGLLVAPTTVVGSTLLDSVAPLGTATEAFTVMVMGIVAGTALGNGLGGAIVDGAAFEAAVLAAGGIAAAGALVALRIR